MWMNVACLVGRATSEPRRKTTTGGTEYATLRVAVRRSADQTDFFTVELWGRVAKIALKHVTTGRMIALRCELRQHEWGKGDERKERVSLVARKIGLLSTPGETVIDIDAA